MKVNITKPTRAVVMPCIVEVSQAEADRLIMMGVAEPLVAVETAMMETPEVEIKKRTRKAKK